MDERVDVRMTFKITGENFVLDSVDMNGAPQNNLVIYSLLNAIYADYQ